MAQVFETAGRFAARTAYNTDFVAAVKAIPGRRWDADAKLWTVGAEQAAALRALVEQFFGTEEEATEAASVKDGPKMVTDFPTLEAYAKYVDQTLLKHAQSLPSIACLNVVFHPIHAAGQTAPVGFRVEVVAMTCSLEPGVSLREVVRNGAYKHLAAFFEAA